MAKASPGWTITCGALLRVRRRECDPSGAHLNETKRGTLVRQLSRPVQKLPNLARSENFVSTFELEPKRARRRSRSRRIGPPKVVRFLAMAEEFQGQLEAGEVRSKAELARRNDLQRARVTQLMGLLNLHPVIRDFVRTLDARTPEHAITERKLKALEGLALTQQLVAARKHLPGFAAFISARPPGVSGTISF
jgi:hypothetical protein